jgi:hypothetical protein
VPGTYRTPRLAAGLAIALATGAASTAPLAAQDISFGLTGDIDTGAAGAVIEFHGQPVFGQPGTLTGRWGVAARADLDGNAWAGAGFVLNFPLSDAAFVEASFMPGYYAEGDRDLGGNLHFRSLIGFGYAIAPRGAVVLSLDHISNGGIESHNPGAETVALSYRMAF